MPTVGFQALGAKGIAILLAKVNRTIEFDRQESLWTGEVEHIPTNRVLATKAQPCQSLPSHFAPKNLFSRGHLPAKLARYLL